MLSSTCAFVSNPRPVLKPLVVDLLNGVKTLVHQALQIRPADCVDGKGPATGHTAEGRAWQPSRIVYAQALAHTATTRQPNAARL